MSGEAIPTDSALHRLAAGVAPGLLDEVLHDSRHAAAEILRSKLTAAMLDEVERLLEGRSASAPAASAPAAAPPAPAASPPAPAGWYVYGLTWGSAARGLDVPSGVDGAPVELVCAGDLAAVVSPLRPTGLWGVDGRGEADLESLAPRARQHERVLEQVLDLGAVLPLRFGVLYPSLDRIRAVLDEQAATLAEALRRVDGHREWGLTITVEQAPVDRPTPSLTSVDGRDYLARRRAEREAAERQADEQAAAVAEIHRDLDAVAAAAVVHRAVAGTASRGKVVMRASYLVAESTAAAFRQAAEAGLRSAAPALGLSGDLTGPWPPYHFCDVSLEGVPA